MLYMILADDAPDSLPARRATRPAHLQHLRALIDQGRLVLAGPRPRVDSTDPGDAGFHGSLIVAEFPTLEDAQAWARQDPYAKAGVFERVIVQPFVRALP
ncbi:YciI family protein [Fontimonas sp. SYSU GA230001]|uniref:YciI family protein n=1 Tax=Fontimonas sp. SYSU GA230001 TaxID=3142450 RepID=UPI0032B528DC